MCKVCENYHLSDETRVELHAHTDRSNIRLLDSINSIEELIQTASDIGLKGVAVTDHEILSAHVKAIQTARKLKREGKIPEDFKLILGNEIYLVDSIEEVKDNYQSGVTKFPHFLLISKNKKGHEALRILSSKAWENSFYTGTMERVPTVKEDLANIIKQYPDCLIGSSACFLEGTKVNVNGKLMNIEEISSNIKILTHKGEYRNVVFPTSRQYKGNVHTIVTKGSSFPITSTSEHKFLVIPAEKQLKKPISDVVYDEKLFDEFDKKYRTLSRGGYKLKLLSQKIEPTWVEAKDLNKNHELLKLIDDEIVDIDELDISKHHIESSKYKLPNIVPIDEDLLWLLGIYTAEGSLNTTTKGAICFTIDSKKRYLINKISKIVKEKFRVNVSINKKKEQQGVDISANSIELYSLFSEWFDSGAINKAIPLFIKKLPFEKQVHFLKGYFLGDGYYRIRNNGGYNISCSSISKQLIYDISSIFHRGSINPLINQNPAKIDKKGVNHQQWYSLELNGSLAKKFIDFIFNDKELIIEPSDYRYKDIPFVWEGRKYVRNKVVGNSAKEYEGVVYCLNVDKDHSFEAEGNIVHNCLGSESSIHIIEANKARQEGNKQKEQYHTKKLMDFIEWNIEVFGKDDFYLELQPATSEEQIVVNKVLVKMAKHYDLKLIVTNDAHYLRPEDMEIHEAYLKSKEDERETADFYASTYLHKIDEIYSKMDYLDKDVIHQAIVNTMLISKQVEDYTIEDETVIPETKLPEFELKHLFKKGYEKYHFIGAMAYSESEQDRFLLHLIEEGFLEHIYVKGLSKEYFNKVMERINVELQQLWEISDVLNQRMSSYYVTIAKIVELIWGDDCGDNSRYEGSLVGAGRGSAVAFLINYLMGVTQVNPLVYGIEVPYWRHLHKSRADISALDIDIDITSTKKHFIFDRMRAFYGEKRVIQVCTFGTEKSKSAVQTACRGLGIDSDTAQYISSFIPSERGELWTLKECLYGNEEKGREPIKQFINEIEKYPKLKETALKIEGLINKRSIHAGGVLVLNEDYTERNAMMKAPNGTPITQFNLDDSQAMGAIKFDVLTIEGNDKIQTCLELLLEYGEIEWQGTLRKTFEKYFHPERIDKENPEMFKLIGEDKVLDLFQFSTSLGQQMVKKVKPSNLIELVSVNSLMRLMTDSEEQPIDTFIRYKNDINLWYQEMKEYGLTEEEVAVFEKYLRALNGVADTQEAVMLMAMDENIAGFTVKEANYLRKGIAKFLAV